MNFKKIKSYEDACTIGNINPADDIPYANPANSKQEGLNAFAELDTIGTVINDDPDFPNWEDAKQEKWVIYFNMRKSPNNPAGFGLTGTYYVYWRTDTAVGERLVYNSRPKAEYMASQFLEKFKKLMKK